MKPYPDLYKILQVDPEAEADIIAVAYRRLAAKYHPDVNPSPDAEQRMRALNAAYEILSDPVKRAEYDQARRQAMARSRRSTRNSARKEAKSDLPILAVSPKAIPFGQVQKGAALTARLEVVVSNGRTLIGEVRATHPWIHLSVNRLFSDRTAVQVTVDTSQLEEGRQYVGAVVVESIVYGTKTVPVSLSVAPAPRPVLRVMPTFLDFGEIRFGQPPKVLELHIINGGSGVLNGTVRPLQPWLSVSQSSFAGNSIIQVMACGDGLPDGHSYTGELEIASNGGKAILVAKLDVPAASKQEVTPVPSLARDLLFLQERLRILNQQPYLSELQEQERNIIRYLLRTCRGGDVRETLQKGIASAKGAESIGWQDERGVLRSPAQAITVLTDLLERLHKWEKAEA